MTRESGEGSRRWESLDPALSLSLLAGWSFLCRPDCALCCFATPAVTPSEMDRLLRIEPAAPFERGEAEFSIVPARPRGGACHFLTHLRCRVHPVRPFPCATYPVMVHLGSQAQADIVLSCPGVDLAPLSRWEGVRGPCERPMGLDQELERVAEEYGRRPVRAYLAEGKRREDRLRSRMQRRGGWIEPADLRELFHSDLPVPEKEDLQEAGPPDADSIADLPLFWDSTLGRVAFRRRGSAWEFQAIREEGGPQGLPRIFEPIHELPGLEPEARRMLEGYLHFCLERDFLIWMAYSEASGTRDASLEELVEAILRSLSAEARVRGAMRARLLGRRSDPLDRAAVEWGIRATDSDFLDQGTLGRVL